MFHDCGTFLPERRASWPTGTDLVSDAPDPIRSGARRRFGQRKHQASLRGCAPPPLGLARWTLARRCTLAEYLAARFEVGHSPVGPATERVLAGSRREGRGRGQVVGVRWEQADAATAVAASSGGSVKGLRGVPPSPRGP